MGRATKGTPRRLGDWLRRQPTLVEGEREMRLLVEGLGEPTVLMAWPADAALASGDEWGAEVMDAAQDDCDGRGHQSTYLVQLWDHPTERPLLTYPIRLQPERESIESATTEGMVAQALRHNEVVMRTFVGAMSGMLKSQGQVLAQLTERLQASEMANAKALDLYREAMERSAALESSEEERELKVERERMLLGVLGQIKDAAVPAVVGKFLSPGAPAPALKSVKK
jgi:hypothetical protein